jgi:hypothetical protein
VKEKEHTLVQVNPFHVKRSKELDDNTPGKSDRKDPKTIAMLVWSVHNTVYTSGIICRIKAGQQLKRKLFKKDF